MAATQPTTTNQGAANVAPILYRDRSGHLRRRRWVLIAEVNDRLFGAYGAESHDVEIERIVVRRARPFLGKRRWRIWGVPKAAARPAAGVA